jgi:hypothetical protein
LKDGSNILGDVDPTDVDMSILSFLFFFFFSFFFCYLQFTGLLRKNRKISYHQGS